MSVLALKEESMLEAAGQTGAAEGARVSEGARAQAQTDATARAMNGGAGVGRAEEAHRRIEELGKIIMAYSEVTEKLQQSHDDLQKTVMKLREELGEKNRLLERKKRLSALGEMAAGMAHEIRNPLGGIQLYASMLGQDLREMGVGEAEGGLKWVEKISQGVRRLEALVGQVLHFTREIRLDVAECPVGDLIREAVELSQERVSRAGGGAGVRVSVSGDDALVVKVDRVLLGQAVMNLVINAAEAAGTEAAGDDQGMGWVSVRYARRDVARGGITAAGDLPASRPAAVGLRLVVCDSGGGISAEMADRIFNPFFTTKSTGCGLGLSVVHRIVEAHDGSVRVLQGEEALQEHAAARVEMLRQGWADVRQQASGAVFEILI